MPPQPEPCLPTRRTLIPTVAVLLLLTLNSPQKFKSSLLAAKHFWREGSGLLSRRKDPTTPSFLRNHSAVEVLNSSAGEDSDYSFRVPMRLKQVHAPILKPDFPRVQADLQVAGLDPEALLPEQHLPRPHAPRLSARTPESHARLHPGRLPPLP